jgi:energy-coupling factor transport system permease protein
VVRRGRLVRTAVPIVESGLERALALAESMDARGFARHTAERRERAAAWLGFGSLLALGAAFVALVGRAPGWAVVAAAVGTVGLIAAMVAASRSTATSRYRPRRLTRLDATVAVGVLGAPAVLIALRVAGHDTLTWWPDPIRFPEFSLWPALGIALLAVPVLVPATAPEGDVRPT